MNKIGSGSKLVNYNFEKLPFYLKENKENSTKEDWELISINAIPKGLAHLPMGPVTMMRNQLNLKGGTKAMYSSEEWAEAVRFWQNFAPLEPKNELS